MLVNDILFSEKHSNEQIDVLSQHCRQFIDESDGLPLFKNLSIKFNDFHKVKIRRQKRKSEITKSFNEAFKNQYTDLRQRALFVYGSQDNIPLIENQELFYVFPIDGFQYMYNTAVTDSNQEYKSAFDTMLEKFENNEEAVQIITDLLQYTYSSTDLSEGIQKGVEVIVYNIPYYFAMRANLVEDYTQLLTSLK